MPDEATRYEKSLADLADLPADHPYRLVRDRLAPGDKVLDVGCGSGEIGEFLAAAGLIVDGIEANPERAAVAARRLRVVESAELGPGFESDRLEKAYDAILFIDVIEHLVDPGPAVAWCREHLTPTGRIVCLIPNAAHYKVRKKIAKGDWRYEDQGPFDRDHVRFYDTSTVGELPGRFGLTESFRRYSGRYPRRYPARLRPASLKRWPNLFAYNVLVEWTPTT